VGQSRKRTGRDGKPRYTAYYDDASGRRRSAGTFASRREADRAWRQAEVKVAEGRLGDPARGRQSFAAYAAAWLPAHEIEARTRETYTYSLERHILPSFARMRMNEIMPLDVRRWVLALKNQGCTPSVIRQCHTILSATFTTALNDQLITLHPCRGVKLPPVAKKVRTILTPEQFDALHAALPTDTARLLVGLDIDTGLRWGELTELRPADLNLDARTITVARVVVELTPRFSPTGQRFLVKDYPKDQEHRRIKISTSLAAALRDHITRHHMSPGELLFTADTVLDPTPPPQHPATPTPAGLTDPTPDGRQYRHGTLSGYSAGLCRCPSCRGAYARYRAQRRAAGIDHPRPARRRPDTDGHIGRRWFRDQLWQPAVRSAGLSGTVRPHDLRHAHASWLLSGGADLQYVKERLGHANITTTQQYLHTLDGIEDAALDALAAIRQRHRAI
jgi:integrase